MDFLRIEAQNRADALGRSLGAYRATLPAPIGRLRKRDRNLYRTYLRVRATRDQYLRAAAHQVPPGFPETAQAWAKTLAETLWTELQFDLTPIPVLQDSRIEVLTWARELLGETD